MMDFRPYYPLPLRVLSRCIDALLALGGLSILILVFANATLRGFAGFDLAWSLEATAFLLLWTTFLGCAAAMARGAHMRVTEITQAMFAPRALHWLEMLINLAIVILLVSLIDRGIGISEHTWRQKTTVLYWPVGLLYASMPVGMFITLIFHLFNSWLGLRGTGPAQPTQTPKATS
ncbi:TRAP transporter small permease subunit [Abyssibius alkaniclasticus]|uniref:TRAP transporter small permease n=1 Tax=Abyssibius alkaniclasticus TaxID=2881234 RepID=UPI0023646033|nr:TRAP transporter small permease subunit [Abyssibius alkaniclasticus]UPH70310.1 TRAP transporter small permease subunit [Abyssibius alkaniclasticus]|tara:strand:+ start:2593 stop:3120 length:528 start_codon:yes stop_codon:yes gene_type:complete